MTSAEYLSSYIKKLGHPLREIRERSLQLLIAKLRLGWEIEDELSGTRELLEALLAWFHVQKPTLQRDALQLLLSTLKTKAGNYIVKEYGVKRLLSKLDALKHKIDQDTRDTYQELIESIQFLNTVEEGSNVDVPRLTIPSVTSSESDRDSNQDYLTGLRNDYQSSRDGSISNEDPVNVSKEHDGIQLLLFPWVLLTSSDSKTVMLVEDALKLLKSTRRCCRFICDVFLRDFPPEIFLNRPSIVQNLLLMADTGQGGRPNEALLVLLSITLALNKRVFELSSVDLVNDAYKITDSKETDDAMNAELQELAGNSSPESQDDTLAALRQWPAPLYALETTHTVLTIMARSVVLVDPVDKSEVLDVKTLNTCLSLVESLIQLLLECVTESFWIADHTSKTHRDIAHKSCMVMRLLGDLLTKYKKSYTNYPELSHHRVAWFRLVRCAEKLLRWARRSALPPSSLMVALQAAQLDPALELFYPSLSEDVCEVLQNMKISTSNEFKTKYQELTRLIEAMDAAVKFMKNENSCCSSKQVLKIIKKSLPVIEIHLNEGYLDEVANILLRKARYMDLSNEDWTLARSIALTLMAHSVNWVSIKFYNQMAGMVKSVLVDEDINQIDSEKCLTLLGDVSILTEICCHGMSSNIKEVESSATDIMLYLLRGRMVLSESCWWRLLASLLPIMPLLHVYAEHDTEIGQAICKSLEPEISDCMGVSASENTMGLVRLLFVQCVAVRMEAAHQLCRLLDDHRYLPPRESLRNDVLLNAMRRIKPQSFNVDYSSSPSKTHQTGLSQILDVLKQDIVLDENGKEYVTRSSVRPSLEPSLRRSSLQQLSVLMRQQGAHDAFLRCDGIQLIVAILRMSMMVDDYLAFPECAISCVSILNSVCFASRHILAKIHHLPALLIRVILVFPADDSAVLMSAQILALIAWSGFALQELDANRCQVPALPLSVVDRTILPFNVNSYWSISPNAEHSIVEWLLSDEDWRASVRIRWWCAWESPSRVLKGAPPPPAPLALRPTADDLTLLQTGSPVHEATKALLALENATSHKQVNKALNILESYTHLAKWSPECTDFGALPWQHMRRFLCAPPASPRDTALLIALLHFIVAYMDNLPSEAGAHSWIKSCFLGKDTSIIALLSRDRLFPQQTTQDNIEITQLHIHIIKVLLRCIVLLESYDDFDSSRLESLVKILLACLEKIDLRNFHMLGYLNELMRCIRYALYSRYCKLSENTLEGCLALVTRTLSGCCAGSGRKGQACRLDAVLSLLAMLRQIHEEGIPPQRWSEAWSGDAVRCVVACAGSARASLRAAALRVIAQLARYSQLSPQLLQAIPSESMAQYAVSIISNEREANAVRAAAVTLLTVVASRPSHYTDVLESEILLQLQEYNFLETCIDIFVEFCNETKYQNQIEPNVPMSLLERRSELEVRAEKCADVRISPSMGAQVRRAPTASLVAALADVLHNVAAFKQCPVQAWNEQGLYRLLFRCASWSRSSPLDNNRVRAASCCALVAAAPYKCVRASLAATKDCLHNLMMTLTPLDDDELNCDALAARTQALLLLGSLLPDRSTGDSVWTQLRTGPSAPFFSLLLQCLESDVTDFQDAALFCLTQLSQSAANRKHPDKTQDESCIQLLDNMKALRFDNRDLSAGDAKDCQPEYLVEELCRALMQIYQNMAMQGNVHESSQDERWCRLCSCLASLLSVSARGRLYSVHRQFPRTLLATLQTVRDRLSMVGQPVEVIRNANNNPTLRTLYWLLTLISCLMTDCLPAKESLAEDNIALSLNRLWPWCMMTEPLREAVVHLLLTFTNNCPKAWSAMCLCVAGRSLLLECCSLLSREVAAASRARSELALLACVRVLRHTVDHHHCRAVILKSEALPSLHKMRWRARSGALSRQWGVLCCALARHADGAAAVLALKPRAAPLAAVAHAACHPSLRPAFLNDPELLEMLTGSLLTGDIADIVSAARAVWALAANNHKAKLLLRSARVPLAVHSAQQRLQRSTDPAAPRALQLIAYTRSVLQTT
ncbi:rotatin-like [Cydia splendana]|uniref:rotatin-like n=1 Tax=Cydia splendana TaxID=1100963 RepID=UPI0028F466F3